MGIYLDRIQQAKETLRRNYPEAETIDTQFDGVFYEV